MQIFFFYVHVTCKNEIKNAEGVPCVQKLEVFLINHSLIMLLIKRLTFMLDVQQKVCF